MKRTPTRLRPSASHVRGFSLTELMVTMLVLGILVIALGAVLLSTSRTKIATTNRLESSQSARVSVDMIAKDLRSAGYGADGDYTDPQLPIAYVDSLQILICANLNPNPDTAVVKGYPLAYSPNSTPKPAPLDGTVWAPPIRYRTGAEIIRWTLDVNNDGQVNASDIASPGGADAARTRNPNDYVLVRQVYGDSTGGVTGNNGGSSEVVALVLKPGGAVPPIFTVYMKGSSAPYNWSLGPVPRASLKNIERIGVRITAPSPVPNAKGEYATTEYSTQVTSLRNIPTIETTKYVVDGYVFRDDDNDKVMDAGEPGIEGARMKLGRYSVVANASGYYQFQIPAGTYTLRHTPSSRYIVTTNPDSFVVTVPPTTSRNFSVVPTPGGDIHSHAYLDLDEDGVQDPGEEPLMGVPLKLTQTGERAFTDSSGNATLFSPVGAYEVVGTAPDSFAFSTPSTVSGTMVNGGSANFVFGLRYAQYSTLTGKVYIDVNHNGAYDTGESGIANVWVGVTSDNGASTVASTYTASDGSYAMDVPVNDPPHTIPYYVQVVPPTGFFPTTTTNAGPLWIQVSTPAPAVNYGMSAFQQMTLDATRILSLGAVNLSEADDKNADKRHMDTDIVLGSDANGKDQISVWFNDYNKSPLFDSQATYSRSAPNSVLSLALAKMDQDTLSDLVTGTKSTNAGNFFVWLNQSSKGNEGYFPNTYNKNQNYKTADNGEVQVVLVADVAGSGSADANDIIVGTKSPVGGQGSVEVWRNTNVATLAFVRDETYPTSGGLSTLGEVNAMALGDFNGDGKRDLVIGTRISDYSGRLIFLKFVSRTSPHFLVEKTIDFPSDIVTSIAVLDVDGDGKKDVIAGTQNGSTTGRLVHYRNTTVLTIDFELAATRTAPGIVQTLACTDLGGAATEDLIVGYRTSTTGFGGGLRVYYMDAGVLPLTGTDPSGGSVVNFVPAIAIGNFNFGLNPLASPPYQNDFAAGAKVNDTTASLIIFIR